MDVILNQVFVGLSIASILLLVALGLTFTFGQMNVINMAHGEFIMAGAYTTYVLQTALGTGAITLAFGLALPVAFVVAGTLGLILEFLVIRRLYGRPLDTLLATWGVASCSSSSRATSSARRTSTSTRPTFLDGGITDRRRRRCPTRGCSSSALVVARRDRDRGLPVAHAGRAADARGHAEPPARGRQRRAHDARRPHDVLHRLRPRRRRRRRHHAARPGRPDARARTTSSTRSSSSSSAASASCAARSSPRSRSAWRTPSSSTTRPRASPRPACSCSSCCSCSGARRAWSSSSAGGCRHERRARSSCRRASSRRASSCASRSWRSRCCCSRPAVLSDFRLSLLAKFLCFAIIAARHRPRVGPGRHARARPGPVLRARRLLHGHAHEARRRRPRQPARLHDLERQYETLPALWKPFRSAWFAIPMAILLPMAIAALLGAAIFRQRVRGAYFAILSQALAGAFVIVHRRQPGAHRRHERADELPDVLRPVAVTSPADQRILYFVVAIVLLLVFLATRSLVLAPLRAAADRVARRRGPRALPRLRPGARSSSSPTCWRPAWPASPARCSCRSSASSRRRCSGSCRRSRWSSGSRSAGARCSRGRRPGAVIVNWAKIEHLRAVPVDAGCTSRACCSSS